LASWATAPLDKIYLIFCAPLVLALVYILPPFQAPDEASHFYRAVQLSHGEMRPTLVYNSYRQGAGGTVDASAHRLIARYCGTPNWNCRLKTRPPLADLVDTNAAPADTEARQVVAFSNTVVYLPLAHAVPALAITVARSIGISAIGWLYAGRAAAGLFAIAISYIALRLTRFQRPALLIFAIATLPMVTSMDMAIGADSAVISCGLLLMAICVRLLDGRTDNKWLWTILVLAVVYAAAAKLAYLPLAFIPFACAAACDRPRVLVGTALVAAVAVGVLLAWSAVIHADVFPISLDLRVDPPGQVAFVRDHPIAFFDVLLKSMILESPHVGSELIGSRLAAWNVFLPKQLFALSAITLALASLASGVNVPDLRVRFITMALLAAGASATFAFLYLQNSIVGGPEVIGYQGRYLLPLLPFIALVLPKLGDWRFVDDRRLRQFVAAGGCLATVSLVLFFSFRAWV
jgi:uncharacterized membrane protein